MTDKNENKNLVIKEDYATQLQLQYFESRFISVVESYGLPSENIFVGVTERAQFSKMLMVFYPIYLKNKKAVQFICQNFLQPQLVGCSMQH